MMGNKQERDHRRETLRPHPARDQILGVMRNYGKPLSPTQIARITGASLGATAYHVRTLEEAGQLELADEGRVRGAVEHFYTLIDGADTPPASDPARLLLSSCGALTVPDPEGGYPRPTVIDDPARDELRELIDELAPKVRAIAAAANARARR
ncbi:helix-turn-helix domain-containing protein [Baekduia sp. Peel2402]|jgi:DNA-binding transcriptional ArsR family regulator|uniref:helix-turn-helix domain-containing protein n=1 Tax=Baekduia sp. Peel2402 TaxID=3458296 RepID=UPI00403E94F0